MTVSATGETVLPPFPVPRPASCPLQMAPEYGEWVAQEGLERTVLADGTPVWAVNRYADIKEALADERLSADGRNPNMPGPGTGPDGTPSFPRMDDPEHNRIRRMFTKDFTVKRIEAMRPGIQKMADDLLDTMTAKEGPADLVQEYALPLPSLVISLLLGVPYDDHEFFQNHTMLVLRSGVSKEEMMGSRRAMFSYLLDLVERKEREPADDLLSRLAQEQILTGQLRREEAVVSASALLVAGHETTANMIALSTLALLQHPDLLARIRDTDDPKVVANAVEELLRYLTIVHSNVFRVATEDLTLSGTRIKAGEAVSMNLPAGNWDPAYTTDPGTFDLDRDTRGHLAFGYGTHQCVGQQLARAELQIALPTLLRRLPELSLAVPAEELTFRNDMIVYGLYSLPVTW
ncbi:cytochrome P450 [Streptomyces phyllanthi]|uniref:Cytochrome P450 n=1 Tax=Streptomyces phyllanthi TaxID=1803180 RepID=A0A5N8VUT0_9ACTN|nr:cytochrome P450 [Streptomyces phyllanthi]MPY38436.1 cytochrome P450 [Streptomyces phyllanthi]